MSKSKKKRNKKYTGIDAKNDDGMVTIRKVTAINRSPSRQWLFDHKKILKISAVAIVFVIIVTAALISLFSH